MFLEENNSIHHFYCQAQGCSHKNMLLYINIKTRWWCNAIAKWELPTGPSVTISHPDLSGGQDVCSAQHRPEGDVIFTGLQVLNVN